jgi:hypothetical protein
MQYCQERALNFLINMTGGRDRLEVDHAEWRKKLDHFRRGGEAEIQVRENYGRDGVEEIHQLAAEQGLYSKAYGKGRNTVLVVSHEPLPNYRADLDAKVEILKSPLSKLA